MSADRRPAWKQGLRFAKRSVGDVATKIAKRITWLNGNAGLKEDINYEDVRFTLMELGESATMRLLKELEQKKDDIQNPTAYIMASARRSLSGESEAKVKQRIQWICDNVQGAEELDQHAVLGPLLELGLPGAFAVLKDYETNAAEVRKPTNYVLQRAKNYTPDPGAASAAAKRRADGSRASESRPVKGVAKSLPSAATKKVIKSVLKDFKEPRERKLRTKRTADSNRSIAIRIQKRVNWLNGSGILQEPIEYDEVVNVLVDIGHNAAMEILKELEENTPEIDNPTSYILQQAASKEAVQEGFEEDEGAGVKGKGKGRKDGGSGRRGAPKGGDSIEEKKLIARIVWLNENAGLQGKVDFDRHASLFLDVGLQASYDILKRLEETASTVRDPNGYVDAALRRTIRDGGGGQQQASQAPPPPPPVVYDKPPPTVPEKKLYTRIDWLNNRGGLNQPIDYEGVADVMLNVGLSEAFIILKELEEQADKIRNPTAFLRSAARRRLEGEGCGGKGFAKGGGKGDGFKGGFPVDPVLEDKIFKRVDWLNRHVPMQAPLMFDKIAPMLLDLDIRIVMDILKNFEETANSGDVRDPNGYVIAAAKRELAGDHMEPFHPMGRKRKRPVDPEAQAEADLVDRIGWMNGNIPLPTPLNMDKVIPQLLTIDIGHAFEILERLQERAPEVRDPNSYVLASVGNARRSGGGGGGKGYGGPPPKRPRGDMPPPPPSAFGPRLSETWGPDDKVSYYGKGGKSNSVPPAPPPPALAIGGNRKGGDREKGGGGGERMGKGGCGGGERPRRGGPGHDGHPPDADEKLRKRIGWLNQHAGLSAPLVFDQVAAQLLKIDLSEAFDILKRLEDSAHDVRDPVKYVSAAVRRAETGPGPVAGGSRGPPRGGKAGGR